MRMDLVVVDHPSIDGGQGSGGIGDRVHPDIVALEGLHDGFGDAVALGALDGRKARHEPERRRRLDGPGCGIGGKLRWISIMDNYRQILHTYLYC